jgi:hypothetical protein
MSTSRSFISVPETGAPAKTGVAGWKLTVSCLQGSSNAVLVQGKTLATRNRTSEFELLSGLRVSDF